MAGRSRSEMGDDLMENTREVATRTKSSYKAAQDNELEMKRRVASLQRQVQHARARMALEAVESRNRHSAISLREDLNKRCGRELSLRLQNIQPASEDEVWDMAQLLNDRMAQIFLDPNSREWFRLFSHIDDDKSGRISYKEFIGMAREELKLTPGQMPEQELQAVWRAIDTDCSGWISAGEFGRFMRKGARRKGLNWKERIEQRNRRKAEVLRVEKDRYAGRALAEQLSRVQPADEEGVWQISELLNNRMDDLFKDPQSREWFRLFSHMDDDGSGRISYKEFIGMVREELKLLPSRVPEEELQQVWRALDEDNSGFINAGEFGRFMRKGMKNYVLASHVPWRARVEARNRNSAEELRQDLAKRSGAGLNQKLSHIEPAALADISELSRLLNMQMEKLFADPGAREWYRLFTHMDDDRSGRISLKEFIGMVREELKMLPSMVPEEELHAVWRALDADASGYITTGEFGRFMRLGKQDSKNKPKHTWKQKQRAQRAKSEEHIARVEAAKRFNKNAARLEQEALRLQRMLDGNYRPGEKEPVRLPPVGGRRNSQPTGAYVDESAGDYVSAKPRRY